MCLGEKECEDGRSIVECSVCHALLIPSGYRPPPSSALLAVYKTMSQRLAKYYKETFRVWKAKLFHILASTLPQNFYPSSAPNPPNPAISTPQTRMVNSPVKNSSKLNVMYPSRSSSYLLKTSVIRFKIIQLCTNKSKLILPSPLLS